MVIMASTQAELLIGMAQACTICRTRTLIGTGRHVATLCGAGSSLEPAGRELPGVDRVYPFWRELEGLYW